MAERAQFVRQNWTTARVNPTSWITSPFRQGVDEFVHIPRRYLSLEQGMHLGAEGIQGKRFAQHIHARVKEIASDGSTLGIAGDK